MKILLSLTLAAACAFTARAAGAQAIGVYFDPAAGPTTIVQPAPGSGTLYILAILGGAASNGIAGAEFRVGCFPPDWYATWSSLSGSPILGSPFGAGAQIAFPSCQEGTNGVVLLCTVMYFATSAVVNHCIGVAARIPPSNPNYSCPVVVICDSPTYTYQCVRGGEAVFNPTDEECRPWDTCPVAVNPATWSVLKGLYR